MLVSSQFKNQQQKFGGDIELLIISSHFQVMKNIATRSFFGVYALGWQTTQRPWAPGNVITHPGSNTFWKANVWLAPESGEGFFAVTNMGSQKAFMATDEVIGLLISSRK